ncbi:hypothetical protein BJ994_002544 [Arthrobacter pigmenti]|uniref:DinB-like domain-containing protein n=1 Tax=Arthrobacter pigmenti TaxID=271432 RepID=A0A846RJI8_9MICC|nr:DinB family protein [Arthrobacter pigmenti]NJC23468.1 hypothetical protein [Arthrobacter pigmenti]
MPIEPDSKDWTWVLERPCEGCGLDAGAFPPADIPDRIRADLPHWRTVLERSDVANRPDAGTWSPLEYAAHVRDVFALFIERTDLMLREEDPLFANWDQDRTAAEKNYAAEDPAAVQGELTAAGEAYAARLEGISDWERVGRRSNGSRFTIATLAQYGLHDVVHHLSDVRG